MSAMISFHLERPSGSALQQLAILTSTCSAVPRQSMCQVSVHARNSRRVSSKNVGAWRASGPGAS